MSEERGPSGPERVVVVDDDPTMRLSCRQILERMGFEVEVFEDGARGLEGAARLKPWLVVVDLKMPGIDGTEVVARVHEMDPETIIVVITGYATIGTAVEAMKCGAYDFLPKPFAPAELRVIVDRGLERWRLMRESRQARLERELLRRRFVTFVSHQLRSPLGAVHQYLDVLRHLGPDVEAEKRAEWLERCLRRTEELQTLISDWLMLAELEGEELARRREPVDVCELLPSILAIYEQTAAEGELTLRAQAPLAGCPVLGDRAALNVLFDNLVVNAIKYNRPGGDVTVVAEVRAGEVVVEVRDTGVGIPERYRPLLFEEFFRVRDGAAPKTSGSGLGLAICRRIATELGGAIEVESEEGVGSTFRVRLPAAPATEALEPIEAEARA